MPQTMIDSVHDVASAATYAKRHAKTVLKALQQGHLEGHQRAAGCTWRIYQSDLDRWIRGEKPARSARRSR